MVLFIVLLALALVAFAITWHLPKRHKAARVFGVLTTIALGVLAGYVKLWHPGIYLLKMWVEIGTWAVIGGTLVALAVFPPQCGSYPHADDPRSALK